ncbi:unnamed protein product [Brassicogethes aeneus]|uniref:Cell cycle checkpoint control protein RAD9A n=1 Tax=Brassicogethes aeneus TaxID=1431903 RepID=A0A9P0AUR9_BRAAE|nr:unnamed protein product [Brassicogethes aeneus]
MNCVIPGGNVKVLARGLQALAKIGDDLFIEFKKELISFVALNQSKTVCSRFNLLYSYFSTYDVNEEELRDQSNNAINCKIHMKVLLPLFKGINLDKKFEYIKIDYETNADIILFKMKYKCDDIVMLHKLRLMDTEVLKIGVNTSSGSNNTCATNTFYNQLMTMFSNSDDEITLEIERDKLVARNYFVGAPPKPRAVRSQVNLNGSEFLIYKIETETTINFSLKPFRTAIQFADGLGLNIGFNFETGGRPMSMLMKNPTFELIFIVATLNPYSDGQSTITAASIPARITQQSQNGANITVEDQLAILNENWDEFEIDENQKDKRSTPSATTRTLRVKAKEKVFSAADETVDVLPESPESPRTKRAKVVFGRCLDPTFSETMLGEVLVGNSDSE